MRVFRSLTYDAHAVHHMFVGTAWCEWQSDAFKPCAYVIWEQLQRLSVPIVPIPE